MILPIILVLISSIFGAYGAINLKQGANILKFNFWKLLKNTKLITGILLYVTASAFTIAALKFGELSLVFPLSAVTYIWIELLAKKYLNETITTRKWLGIAIIIIGVCLIGISS